MQNKIIVYGLGQRFIESRNFIQSKYEVVGYCDKDIKKCREEFREKFIRVENIRNYIFDFILVTSWIHFDNIKKEICMFTDISENKIKSLYDIQSEIWNPERKNARLTSITDTDLWPYFCTKAANDTNIFDTFRSNPITLYTCEHFEEKWDQEMLENIEKNPQIKFTNADWDDFLKNDNIGSPICKKYLIHSLNRKANCTTLRYVKILQELLNLFEDMSTLKNIVEIGGGYGGQCRIILSYLSIAEYTLIDLPEVLELMKCYLSKFENTAQIHYIDGTAEFEEKSYDLVISNYALSEMVRDIQKIYLDKVISHAKRGYIIWNNLMWKRGGGMCLDEFMKHIPDSFVIEEKPQTGVDNCIIIWGSKM